MTYYRAIYLKFSLKTTIKQILPNPFLWSRHPQSLQFTTPSSNPYKTYPPAKEKSHQKRICSIRKEIKGNMWRPLKRFPLTPRPLRSFLKSSLNTPSKRKGTNQKVRAKSRSQVSIPVSTFVSISIISLCIESVCKGDYLACFPAF